MDIHESETAKAVKRRTGDMDGTCYRGMRSTFITDDSRTNLYEGVSGGGYVEQKGRSGSNREYVCREKYIYGDDISTANRGVETAAGKFVASTAGSLRGSDSRTGRWTGGR